MINEEKEDDKVKNPMEQTLDFLKNLYLQNKEEIDRVAKEYKVIEADKAESEVKMGMTIDEHLKFEDDKLYHYYPLPQFGDGICKKDLVMTKEIFIECYKRWIKGVDNGNDD